MMTLAGEQWTHVAMAIPGDDGLRTVELGPKGMLTRSVDEFIDAYELVGLARPRGSTTCRRAMTTAARLRLEFDDVEYSWSRCVIIGSTAILQRLAPDGSRSHIARGGLRAVDRFTQTASTDATKRPATCSSMIVDLLDARCDACRPLIRWPARSAVRPWEGRPSAADVVGLDGAPPLPRTSNRPSKMATPADIWVADGFSFRAVTDRARTTLIRNASLTSMACERGPTGNRADDRPPRPAAVAGEPPLSDRQPRAGKEVTS
ncbi:MAG: hypothetical protein AAF962_14085 [Actinomycetota bacterium]